MHGIDTWSSIFPFCSVATNAEHMAGKTELTVGKEKTIIGYCNHCKVTTAYSVMVLSSKGGELMLLHLLKLQILNFV
jgi:hypothetical protein